MINKKLSLKKNRNKYLPFAIIILTSPIIISITFVIHLYIDLTMIFGYFFLFLMFLILMVFLRGFLESINTSRSKKKVKTTGFKIKGINNYRKKRSSLELMFNRKRRH